MRSIVLSEQLEKSFYQRVDKNGPIVRPALGPCWSWRGTISSPGYGVLYSQGSTVLAHRLSLVIAGRPPGDQLACHKCDNRSCVRPEHLFIGTHKDNYDDARQKGRLRHFKRITDEQVLQMRMERMKGRAVSEIAKEYGVGLSYASQIIRGKNRTSVPWVNEGYEQAVDQRVAANVAARAARTPGRAGKGGKLTSADVLELRALRKTGKSLAELAGIFGIQYMQAQRIVWGQRWQHIPFDAEYEIALKQQRATYCISGHERATHWYLQTSGAGVCRACEKQRDARKKARKSGTQERG